MEITRQLKSWLLHLTSYNAIATSLKSRTFGIEMDPGTKYPTTRPEFSGFFTTRARPEPEFWYPADTRNPTCYPRVPEGTQLGKICWIFSYFSKIFGYFQPNFRIFRLFPATKFWNIFLDSFCQILNFLTILNQNFKIFGYFPQKTLNFSSKFTQPTTRRVPGYPIASTRVRNCNTRAYPGPDFWYPNLPGTRLFDTRCIPRLGGLQLNKARAQIFKNQIAQLS